MLIVISGPSGCGKTSIAHAVLQRYPELSFSVSATTRQRRANEIDGKDYYFVSKPAFEEKIRRGELAEWEQIYDDYYGTPNEEIRKAHAMGRSILLDIDVKGALSVKKKYPDRSFLIFVKPPSLEVLKARLMKRKTESTEALQKRMDRVAMEMGLADQFHATILNDRLEVAIGEVERIVARFVHSTAGQNQNLL